MQRTPLSFRFPKWRILCSDTRMKPIADALLYGILDLGYVKESEIEATTVALLEGGVDVLQLRAKNAQEEEIEGFARRIISLTEEAEVPLLINDHPQLVPSMGAQGAHVGQDDFAVPDARWRAGRVLSGDTPFLLIGKSTHSLTQAIEAAAQGADYIGFGPLFATPTKPGRPAIGLEDIARVHAAVNIPIFCIGGIKRENLEQVLDAGARRVVVVSGILQATDMAGYCREVKKVLEQRKAELNE